MTETAEHPPTPDGPRVDPRQQFQQLDQLRRSRSDKYVAGVCGGLGRHFDIDPTLIRVLFAVTTLFAGAGLIIYAAIWLLVPEDGRSRAALNFRPELTRALLIGAAAIGVLTLTGSAWGGFHDGWVLAVVAVIAVAALAGREHRHSGSAPTYGPQPWAGAPTGPPTPGATPAPAGPLTADQEADVATSYAVPPAAPTWQPPNAAPAPNPRPRRTGLLLFFPTLAMIAIGLGILGLIDRNHAVDAAGYPALALAITGAMLLVGAFRGRPGGLILVGLVSSFALLVASVAGGFHGGRNIDVTPLSSAAVSNVYSVPNGRIDLDLTQVADVRSLAGRTIEAHLNAGDITVHVPSGINVRVTGHIKYAGEIDLGNDNQGGVGGVDASHDFTTGPAAEAPLVLDLSAHVGSITVEQE